MLTIVTWAVALCLSLAIGFLLAGQVYNFSRGVTTLETFTEGMSGSGIFDRGGFLANLEEVMGPGSWWSPFEWVHPE